MNRPLLVLDLDGTLIDTGADLVAALNKSTAWVGLPEIPSAAVDSLVGHGARRMIERAFEYHDRPLERATHDRVFEAFLVNYERNIADHSRPYPGAMAMLDRFAAADYGIAICTNKLEHLACRLLDALGLGQRFEAICGGDTFPVRKPDPAHLLGTIERANGRPDRCLFVGDSETDTLTARAAGIPVAGVTFGYSLAPMHTLGPDLLIDHFDALLPEEAGVAIARSGFGINPPPAA